MTGSSTYNRSPAPVVVAAALSAALGLTSAAPARHDRCDRAEQVACATTVLTGARRQDDDRDGGRGRDRDKRSGNSSDKDGRRGRENTEGRPGPAAPYDFSWGFGKGQGDSRAPRPHEWEETQSFMRQYAPRRQAALDQMPECESKLAS